MNVDEFIQEHFKDIQEVCIAYLGRVHLADDLCQELVITLLDKRTDEKLLEIIDRGEGMFHVTGIVRMMATRPGHKFYYTFICPKKIDRELFMRLQE